MEEQTECDPIGSHGGSNKKQVPRFDFIKLHSPEEVEKEEAEKQYQLLTHARSRINEDLDQRKGDQHQLNRKLMWFYQHDYYIQWKTQEIKNLERCLGKAETNFPEKDVRASLIPDQKRTQKRLIKKGKLDTQYLHQVQEELLSSKKSGGMTFSGTHKVNDLIESMVQKIQHGNKSRTNEMRIYHEIRNVKETKEMYIAPESKRPSSSYSRERTSKRDKDSQRFIQHKINIRLDDIDDMKMDLKGRKARVRRLKAELELVRKSISCLQKELEAVNTKRIKAYKIAYEVGEEKKGLVQ